MLYIGIIYNPLDDLFLSGLNQTALCLAELFHKLGYKISLVSSKNTEKLWWNNYPKLDYLELSTIYKINNLDILIDIDGYINASYRNKIAKKTIVFMRSFLQFTELDSAIYPERAYQPRSFEGVSSIWCWDIINPEETIPSIQTLFPCPIYRVPFIWSPTILSQFASTNYKYNSDLEWKVHIAEKNTNETSSNIIPLVAIRELYLNNKLNAKYIAHNMEHIRQNKFLVENILNNIEIEKLPIEFHKKVPFYEWLNEENSLVLGHSRFIPLRIGLLNAIWLGIPVIHNSPILKELNSNLAQMYYFGNEISSISNVFKSFISNPKLYLEQINQIRNSILEKWGIDANLAKWSVICSNIFTESKISNDENDSIDDIIIAFTDMWPGFNYNSNFFIDALRNEVSKQGLITRFTGVKYTTELNPTLVIFGPFSDTWKSIPKSIPKVFFSGENWPCPMNQSIDLYLTSSLEEDKTHLRIPTWYLFIDWFSKSNQLPFDSEDNPIRIPLHFATHSHPNSFEKREELMAFVVSNPICQFRNETFTLFNSYKKVNSGGALFNNIGGQLALKYPGGGSGDISKYHFFSRHKFTLSFENSQSPGYITEKVLHSKMAGCVPLYWGDEGADRDFVPGSIINLSKFSEPEQILNIFKKLEENTSLCSKIASTPILNEAKLEKALNNISQMANKLIDLCQIRQMPKMIDKIYVVNLDERKDRWVKLLEVEPQLAKIVTRISAVNGKQIQLNDHIYKMFLHNTFKWKKSIMGCFLSHINIWKQIIEEEGEYFIILEDDVRFNKDWLQSWNKYSVDIPNDADLLYLGGVLPPNKNVLSECLDPVNDSWSKIKPNGLFSNVVAPVFHFCTYSYVISKRGAKKLLDFLETSEQKAFCPVDHFLGNPNMRLNTFVANKLLTRCFQDDDPSYQIAQFNNIYQKQQYDSDIINNTECFNDTELELYKNKKMTKQNLTNIYYLEHSGSKLYEDSWISEILGNYLLKPLSDYKDIGPNSWFLVQRPYVDKLNLLFKQFSQNNIDFRVLHLSDEFGKDNIEFYNYSNCKAVIRNYLRGDCPNLKHIITIPLGFHYKGNNNKLFSERELIWSFHGTNWFNRKLDLALLDSLLPHKCHFTNEWNSPEMTVKETYLSDLENSKFCPVPRGNNLETFRLYEALECGTIPIYVHNMGDDTFWELISSKLNLIYLDSWEKASEFIKVLLDRPADAEKYRIKLVENWNNWKKEIKIKCLSQL